MSYIYLQNNKYVYDDCKYLIYRDGVYYPAKLLNFSNIRLNGTVTSTNSEVTVLTLDVNAYVSDITIFLYGDNTVKCYCDDEYITDVTCMGTFNVNRYVKQFKETVTRSYNDIQFVGLLYYI